MEVSRAIWVWELGAGGPGHCTIIAGQIWSYVVRRWKAKSRTVQEKRSATYAPAVWPSPNSLPSLSITSITYEMGTPVIQLRNYMFYGQRDMGLNPY